MILAHTIHEKWEKNEKTSLKIFRLKVLAKLYWKDLNLEGINMLMLENLIKRKC